MPKARVLVVEDDANLLDGIRTILQLDGYTVSTAENGALGLQMLRTTPLLPNLIVSDIMMPEMDGIEFLQQVRKESRWVAIPFIFLTAKGEKADIQRGKRLGVDDYIIKPFEAEDLLIAVDSRLQRQQSLDAAHAGTISEVKRNILAVIHHEFRTPLSLVVGYSDMLSEQNIDKVDDAETVLFLRGVNTGATRLRRLIDNFILLVELETRDAHNTYQLRRGTIEDIEEVLQAARRRAIPPEGREPQPVTIEVEGPIQPFVADREFLTIALTQFVENAMKFSPENQPVTIGAHMEEEAVCLWVHDEGRGIPDSELSKIWDAFYQINRPANEDPGTGSGLAIVRSIVEMHRGYTKVKSQVGKGSTFYIFLPAS